MTMPEALAYRPRSVPLPTRVLARLLIGVALVLARQSPARIQALLRLLRRGARTATYAEAKAARDTVVAVSLTCAARQGCLPRSLATALVCRVHGCWPAWCVGVRRMPPFVAHAWVEAGGAPVDEDYPAGYHRTLFIVR
ncbi:MAG TPA: lasso peptide biosynthesis B2 protein [Micromonosporaceae bacterium]|jgi:hypothetical protein|nr:lasso peptide biosynthesis B2 protein [Micromonosporaceae bacterium]